MATKAYLKPSRVADDECFGGKTALQLLSFLARAAKLLVSGARVKIMGTIPAHRDFVGLAIAKRISVTIASLRQVWHASAQFSGVPPLDSVQSSPRQLKIS